MNTARAALRRGVAGPAEDDVRSDVRILIEPTDLSGLEIQLDSRVASMYGDSIRRQVMEALSSIGVGGARVEIHDGGALPFVLAARLETAARRAGLEVGSTASWGAGAQAAARPPSSKGRVRRSRLYLPGNQPKFMPNAGLHGPDAVILDLEDSVHPDEKDAARILVRNALRSLDFGAAERMVRINQLPLGLEDLEAIVPESPDLLLIPKTESADEVREVDSKIRELVGSDGRPIWLMPIIESALGVERAFDVASASDRVVALTIGLEDYTADLGVQKTLEGTESLYARMRLVNAARAAGVQAIDSVYGDVADEDGLTEWARRSRALGFEGMGCIHPRQIGPIHGAFDPSEAEVERALRIVEAFEAAQAKGLSVVSLGTRMIDPPVVLRAQRIAQRSRLVAGRQDPEEESR